MSEANIQHKSSQPTPVHTGSEADKLVPICWPDEPDAEFSQALDDEEETRIRIETMRVLLEGLLTASDGTAHDLGRKAMLLAHRLRIPGAPANLASLGQSLGVSKTRAHQLVSLFDEASLNGISAQNPTKPPPN